MIVIFQCYGGTHTSVVAASIYTGRLPRGRIPSAGELAALPYFDRLDGSTLGRLHYIGPDRAGNPVFTLGSAGWGREIGSLLASLLDDDPEQTRAVALIDCLDAITPLIRLGGFISRRLGFTFPGRPLVCRGIRRGYRLLLRKVESFERDPAPYILNRQNPGR